MFISTDMNRRSRLATGVSQGVRADAAGRVGSEDLPKWDTTQRFSNIAPSKEDVQAVMLSMDLADALKMLRIPLSMGLSDILRRSAALIAKQRELHCGKPSLPHGDEPGISTMHSAPNLEEESSSGLFPTYTPLIDLDDSQATVLSRPELESRLADQTELTEKYKDLTEKEDLLVEQACRLSDLEGKAGGSWRRPESIRAQDKQAQASSQGSLLRGGSNDANLLGDTVVVDVSRMSSGTQGPTGSENVDGQGKWSNRMSKMFNFIKKDEPEML
eukprot:gene24570-10181_t